MLLISFFVARVLASILISPDAESAGDSFKELGHLFLWGIASAIGVAAIVVFIWLKVQSKRDTSANYTSINPSKHGNQ